ncbi:MAG: hypothetical protein L0211_04530 [Planctomycetaceae bacterium]|nr:hypothetical protein [Planctomycetaceae bacterium]
MCPSTIDCPDVFSPRMAHPYTCSSRRLATRRSAIGADFTAIEFDGLRDGTRARAYADFSLHLSPTDLDILSEVLAERLGVASLLLNDSLVRTVVGSANNSGADVVDPAWVQLVAAVDEAAAPHLAEEWIRRVGAEHGEQLDVTPDAVRALAELIRLCRTAVSEQLAVVHTWYL